MKALNRSLGRFASFGPLVIRLVLGGLFLLHGIDKFRGGIGGVEEFFTSIGAPAPAFAAPVTATIEVLFGTALILGLFTRVSAAVLTALIIGALILVKAEGAVLGGSELDLAYLSGLVSLIVLGPGRFSVDEVLDHDETVIDLRPANSDNRESRTPVGVG